MKEFHLFVFTADPSTLNTIPGNLDVIFDIDRFLSEAMKDGNDGLIHQSNMPWIRCGLVGAITSGTYKIK